MALAGTKRKFSEPSSSPKCCKPDAEAATTAVAIGDHVDAVEIISSLQKRPIFAMKNRHTTGRGVARKLVKKPQRPTEKAPSVDSIVGEPTSAGVRSSDEVDEPAAPPEKAHSASDGSDGSSGAKQTSLNLSLIHI